MAGSEFQAKQIVENYREGGHEIKKSSVTKKVKKGVEYWIANITVTHVAEKEAFDVNFGE
jgi:hypothetical protein